MFKTVLKCYCIPKWTKTSG